MRGVAADEGTPVAEAVGDEPASDPILLRDDIVAEVRPDAENGADRPVAVDRIEFRLAAVEEIVDQPPLASVDGDRGAAAARIEREIEPAALAWQQAQKLGCADISRLHALDDRGAAELRPDRPAHGGLAAVATDQIGRDDRRLLPAVEIARRRGDAALVLDELLDLGAVEHADARMRRHLREQQRLEEGLVDAVRRLRRRPGGIRAGRRAGSLAARRNGNA